MIGAIVGDVIGSVYEFNNAKTLDFELFTEESRFTDDTVMTAAVADTLLSKKTSLKGELSEKNNYIVKFKEYGRRYPDAGYGSRFRDWIKSSDCTAYNSYGNGAAMRVSPIGFAFNTFEDVMDEAERSAVVTHNHPEGIKGAQAAAISVFLARYGESKTYIKQKIEKLFNYDLSRSLEEIRQSYSFDSSCQGSVPQAITAFLQSENFEDAIRKAVFLGGDSDTIACIAGGIAEAYYKKIPEKMLDNTLQRLDFKLQGVIGEFKERYNILY